MVKEAKKRGMRIVVCDPNARGDRHGYATFEETMKSVFDHLLPQHDTQTVETDLCPMFVLAHSAAGTHLQLYLNKEARHLLPSIRAIAFTDSTHNIQWARDNKELQELLESPQCLYLRSSNKNHDDNWQSRHAGDAVETDDFWHRRFGRIRTVWAGTAEHSLTNWFAHAHIWDHFDQHGTSTNSRG